MPYTMKFMVLVWPAFSARQEARHQGPHEVDGDRVGGGGLGGRVGESGTAEAWAESSEGGGRTPARRWQRQKNPAESA